MGLFLISYDLLKPGQDYSGLYAALERLRARRVLLSAWVLRGQYSCVGLRDSLKPLVDANDRLLVNQVSDWAGLSLMIDINQL